MMNLIVNFKSCLSMSPVALSDSNAFALNRNVRNKGTNPSGFYELGSEIWKIFI